MSTLNIYILENDRSFKKHLETVLYNWFNSHQAMYNLMISTSSVSEFLLFQFEKSISNIYFVDASLNQNEPKGLEIAQYIRKRDSIGHIVLLDNSDKYASLTYEYMISALDYILKSENITEEIFSCLEYVRKTSDFIKSQDSNFLTCQRESEFQIDLSEILYFENEPNNRDTLYMVTKNSKVRITEKIGCLESKYSDFFRSHRSYVINVQNIFSLDAENRTVNFQDGSSCPVSHRNWTALKNQIAARTR